MRFAFIFLSFVSFNSFSEDIESTESDILFLKIQELEQEIADLRNELETQSYLLEKLLNEIENCCYNNNLMLFCAARLSSRLGDNEQTIKILEKRTFNKSQFDFH